MITAQQARKKATDITNEVNASLLASIEKKINDAVARGACATQVAWLTNKTVKKELESLGYKVENNSDQRERECYTTISW